MEKSQDIRLLDIFILGPFNMTNDLREKIKLILENARQGTCYCPMGIDHPAFSNHTDACKSCQEMSKQIANEER
jgi:hypothetical protein